MRFLLTLALLAFAPLAHAQGKEGLDSKVPVAPANAPQPPDAVLDSTGIPSARDKAPEASPVAPLPRGTAIRQGTTVSMRLAAPVDSGQVKNGDSVHGTLTAPLRTTSGLVLPAGTRVAGTVVSAAKAGTVQSGGILSLQLTHVGALPVVTDVAEFDGQEGHKDIADSAPEKGTEAIAAAGAVLEFHVLENGAVPGIVPGAHLVQGGEKGGGTGRPKPLPSIEQPNNGAGTNQKPGNGGSQATTPHQ